MMSSGGSIAARRHSVSSHQGACRSDPAGEGLLGYARRILALNDEAVARLREHKV